MRIDIPIGDLMHVAEAFGAKSTMQEAHSIKHAVQLRPKGQGWEDAAREALESVKRCNPDRYQQPKRKPKTRLKWIDG